MLIRKIVGDDMFFYDGDRLVLTVEEPTVDGKNLMILKGELKMEAVSQIQDELDAFSSAHIPITLDLKEVTYCSAYFLEALIQSQTFIDSIHAGEIVLRNVPDYIYDMMDKHNLVDLFYIEDDA